MNKTFQTISPVNGSIFLERSYAEYSEINKVLDKAQKAQQPWQQTTIEDRAAICKKVVEYFLDHADDIAAELTWQMGEASAIYAI